MEKYNFEMIRYEISQYRKNRAAQGQLEAQLRRDGNAMSSLLIERLLLLKEKNTMVEGWLSLLSEDEEYVVRRHLFDGVTWSRIELEYNERWKTFGKTSRTLMLYSKRALEKIQAFVDGK